MSSSEWKNPWQIAVGEWAPEESVDELKKVIWRLDELIIETFQLYPGKMAVQQGSTMPTAELIGAMKMIARENEVKVFMQGAFIKKPTVAQMRARGIKMERGKGGHAKDAFTHLWYRILKQGY